jgi:hypothetical protein
MTSDPFEGPKLKIERAESHIMDYSAAFKTLAESDVVRVHPEFDPETGDVKTIVQRKKALPSDLRLTAADALSNLRSALDQAVSRSTVLARKSPAGTYFPTGTDLGSFKKALSGDKNKKIPEPVRDAIALLKPYYGGDGALLRVLHDLNRADKHTDLIEMGIAIRRITIDPGQGTLPDKMVWFRREDKFELAPAGDMQVYNKIKITLAIAFADVEAVEGQSVTQVLYQIRDVVRRTVGIIEHKTLALI